MPIQNSTDIPTQEEPILTDVDRKLQDLFDYDKMKPRLNKLIGEWGSSSGGESEAETSRDLRYVDIDVEEMRNSDKIDKDATVIPDRVIDLNISREHPAFAQFLKGSRRLAIFKSLDDPDANVQQLELDFTEGLCYPGWYIQFFREVDGAMLHGWDSIEVVLDTSKPLNIGFEHIGYDNLYFNRKVENIQSSELIIRRYKVTALDLYRYVDEFNFDKNEVDSMLNTNVAEEKHDIMFTIYKLYFKCYNVVYVAWFALERGPMTWLKAPEMLDLGLLEMNPETGAMDSLPVDKYPIFLYVYKEDEDKEITSKVGRAYLDEYRQEAHTAVQSSFINKLIRSQYVFASPDEPSDDTTVKQLDIKIKRNMIMNKKMTFWAFPEPSATVLSALQFFGTQNATQSGNVDHAVINRKDARKTAEEMKMAESESSELKTVGLAFYAEHLRDIFSFVWIIVRTQALLDLIKLNQIKVPVMGKDPLTGQQIQIDEKLQNNFDLIAQNFLIKAAGETDVLQREQKIKRMKEDWAVVQMTGLATRFLGDLMRLQYPDVGDEYAKILEQTDPIKAALQSVLELLKGALQPEEYAALSPQEQQGMMAIQQQVVAILGEGATFIPEIPKGPKVTDLTIARQPDGSLAGQKVEQSA